MEVWDPPGVAAPVGRYSHTAWASADHRLVFISGQVGNLPDGTLAGPDLYTQTRQALTNLGTIVDALGATPRDLVKLLTFVVGSDLAGFRSARDEAFDRWFGDGPPPAHSLAIVAGLAAPELIVEVEGVVAVPAGTGGPS